MAAEMPHSCCFQQSCHEKSWEGQANTMIPSEISRQKKKQSFEQVILQNAKESLQTTLGLERSGGEAR